MAERWRVLALLFLVRTAMAFQFGSVGALGPLVGQTFHVDAAGVGFLIGLYLSPGLVIALPGGAIGKFFGDKRAVLAGLALMTLGGAISTFGVTWEAQIAGRVLAGTGGVGLNVVQGAVLASAAMIIGVDLHDDKLAMAEQFGATHTIRNADMKRITRRHRTAGGSA